jgi:hypothetical protein
MPQYRRAELAGGTFFFTIVTFKRKSSFHRYVKMGYYEDNWGEMIKKPFEGLKTGE